MFSTEAYEGKAVIFDFDVDNDILSLVDGLNGGVALGADEAGHVEFTFDNGGSVILNNVSYESGMTYADFNIAWN
jgi:hypothetical protein